MLVEDFKFDPDCGSNSGVKPLQRAIEQGDIKAVKFLLDTGKVNINSQDCRGNTPLHYAARSNQPEIAKLLLLNGAVALFRHHEFRTPEEIAKILENHEVLDVFQKWEKWSRTDSFALSYWQHKVDSKIDDKDSTETL
jgi:FOG: Ankyrin repeat